MAGVEDRFFPELIQKIKKYMDDIDKHFNRLATRVTQALARAEDGLAQQIKAAWEKFTDGVNWVIDTVQGWLADSGRPDLLVAEKERIVTVYADISQWVGVFAPDGDRVAGLGVDDLGWKGGAAENYRQAAGGQHRSLEGYASTVNSLPTILQSSANAIMDFWAGVALALAAFVGFLAGGALSIMFGPSPVALAGILASAVTAASACGYKVYDLYRDSRTALKEAANTMNQQASSNEAFPRGSWAVVSVNPLTGGRR